MVLTTHAFIMVKAPVHYDLLITKIATIYTRPDNYAYAACVKADISTTLWAEETWQSEEFKEALEALDAIGTGVQCGRFKLSHPC